MPSDKPRKPSKSPLPERPATVEGPAQQLRDSLRTPLHAPTAMSIAAHQPSILLPFFDRSYTGIGPNLPPLKQSFSHSPGASDHIFGPPEQTSLSAPAVPSPVDGTRKRKSIFLEEGSDPTTRLPPLAWLQHDQETDARQGQGLAINTSMLSPQEFRRPQPLPRMQSSQTAPQLHIRSGSSSGTPTTGPLFNATSPSVAGSKHGNLPFHSRPNIMSVSNISPSSSRSDQPRAISAQAPGQRDLGPSPPSRETPQERGRHHSGHPPLPSPSLGSTASQSPMLTRGMSPVSLSDASRSNFASMPPQNIHMMTMQTAEGAVQVPLDVQGASRVADEKRKRNAGASARFRQRRKKREQDAEATIRTLEGQVKQLQGDVEYYKSERNYFREAAISTSGPSNHFPRPVASPRLSRLETNSATSPDPSESNVGDFVEDSFLPPRNVRRRMTDGQPAIPGPFEPGHHQGHEPRVADNERDEPSGRDSRPGPFQVYHSGDLHPQAPPTTTMHPHESEAYRGPPAGRERLPPIYTMPAPGLYADPQRHYPGSSPWSATSMSSNRPFSPPGTQRQSGHPQTQPLPQQYHAPSHPSHPPSHPPPRR